MCRCSRRAGARRRMGLLRDVFPPALDSRGVDAGQAARDAMGLLVAAGLLSAGDRVVFTSGEAMETHGATNTLRLLQVGEDGAAQGLGTL